MKLVNHFDTLMVLVEEIKVNLVVYQNVLTWLFNSLLKLVGWSSTHELVLVRFWIVFDGEGVFEGRSDMSLQKASRFEGWL